MSRVQVPSPALVDTKEGWVLEGGLDGDGEALASELLGVEFGAFAVGGEDEGDAGGVGLDHDGGGVLLVEGREFADGLDDVVHEDGVVVVEEDGVGGEALDAIGGPSLGSTGGGPIGSRCGRVVWARWGGLGR